MRHVYVALVLFACSSLASAQECKYSDHRSLSLPPTGFSVLELQATTGTVQIQGDPGLQSVEVDATLCSSQQEALAAFELAQSADRSNLISTGVPEVHGVFGGGYAYMNLVIRMPAILSLHATGSPGLPSINVTGLAAMTLTGAWQDVAASHIGASVQIEDADGNIKLDDVGTVHILDNGDGDIIGKTVRGNASVDKDGDGRIYFENVDGNVEVGADKGGNIFVRNVSGDFTVHADSTGMINYSNVKGTVKMP